MNVLLFEDYGYYFIVIPKRCLITYRYENITELLDDRYNLNNCLELRGYKYKIFYNQYFVNASEREINEIKDKCMCKIPYDVFFSEGLEKEFPELFV